jgi:hypothetical protein
MILGLKGDYFLNSIIQVIFVVVKCGVLFEAVIIIIIVGSTALRGPWPSSEASAS